MVVHTLSSTKDHIPATEDSEVACGIDLGGTKIAIAIGRPDGSIISRRTIRDHRALSEDRIVGRVAESVQDLVRGLEEERGTRVGLVGVAVGTAGHVSFKDGMLISNSNLPGFVNYPLARKMTETLGTPVVVDNDTNAQVYAEYLFGAGRDHDNVAFVTVSTGFGAGIVIDGRVYRGVSGTAGEIGHTIVNPHSRIQCGCGNYGCLMAHTSGLSLPQVVREKARSSDPPADLGDISDAMITGEYVKERFDAGDRLFMDVVFEYADYLGLGLHNLVETLNPGVVILGGGLTAWGEPYLDRARERYRHLVEITIHDPPEIRLSALGADAAVIGAIALAFETGGVRLSRRNDDE